MRFGYSVKTALLTATALSMFHVAPAFAQATAEDEPASGNDIIVTAQRQEQRLQDVPISITVLDANELSNNNITSAKDIATYTPGLTTNNRYGVDNTTWTIRGFTQEQRTTSTVGTYFADVVAPRGSGATQGGDGAGPGYLFDLQNVQVLKGPQGTLFGRNSTGGAVLLVPQKPKDNLEGYVEGSVGNYGMWRAQAVANIPLADTFRIRLGFDHMKRNGYLKNAGKIGFGPHGDAGGSADYWAARLSIVGDLTPDLENYTIFNYSNSKSTSTPSKIVKCFPTHPVTNAAISGGVFACAQKDREDALGFWSVSNGMPDPQSNIEQWQVINTTTWHASDNLTIKNIFSYAEFRGVTNMDLFGYAQPLVTPGTETMASQVKTFNTTHAIPNGYTNAQSSMVEELQFSGRSSDSRFVWQGGLYLEVNKPLGPSGIQSTTQTPCNNSDTFDCVLGFNTQNNPASLGRLGYQPSETTFNGKAIYAQASYDILENLKFTAGARYTWDTVKSDFQLISIRLWTAPPAAAPVGTPSSFIFCTNEPTFGLQNTAGNPYRPLSDRFTACKQHLETTSSKPTWQLGLNWKPIEDVMLYGKWVRGYRQGGIAVYAADKTQVYQPETVDLFEIGAKTNWRGSMPGYFNISGFLNNIRNQQIQFGVQCNPVSQCPQTTAIVNAGKSKLNGFEIEAGISPFQGLQLDVAYAYLNTKIISVVDLTAQLLAQGYNDPRPVPAGGAIPNAMPHKLILSGRYTLPLPESIGKISIGGSWIYQSAVRVVTDAIPGSNTGVLPSSRVGNINVNWENVGGLPLDASLFITNVGNEHVFLHVNDQTTSGFASYNIGEPRMWGFRLKYRFGS